MRKNTKDRLVCLASRASSGLASIHLRILAIDISSLGMMLRSIRIRPTGVNGNPL